MKKEKGKDSEKMMESRRGFLKGVAGAGAIAMLGGTAKLSAMEIQDQDLLLTGKDRANFEVVTPQGLGTGEPSEFMKQIELLHKAASTRKERAAFISDPYGYADRRNIDLDVDFADEVSKQLIEIERAIAGYGVDNPHLAENGVDIGFVETKANASGVAAGAAAVGAATMVIGNYMSARASQYC